MFPVFSLRWRLMSACVLLVVLTAGGMCWFSRGATLHTASSIVESALRQLLSFIEEEVRVGHALTVEAKVNALRFNRAYLRDEGAQLNTLLDMLRRHNMPEADILHFLRSQKKIPLNVGTRFSLYEKRSDGVFMDVLSGVPVSDTAGSPATSLRHIIAHCPEEGGVSVFRDGGGVMSLGAFLPSARPGWTIVTYRELAAVEAGTAQLSEAIVDRVRQLISGVTILKSGFLAAVDGAGRIQSIGRGAELPPEVLRSALEMDPCKPRRMVLDLADTRMEYRISYIRPFDWRLVIAVPTRELEAPADALTARLMTIAGVAVLLGVLAAFAMYNRIVLPLRRLAALARLLPIENILDLHLEAFDRLLPTHRGDEVGGLARSFSYMAHELRRNVTSLVEASSARERLQAELNVAREIQEGILPKIFPPYPERRELDLFATSEPAKEVGGDLYDFFFVDENRLCLVIGDVSDKGVPAALYMSITVTLVRVAMQEAEITPEKALERVNFNLAADSTRGMFVTLCIGVLDLADGTLRWASGGHPSPLLLRGSSVESPAPSGDLVVGALPDTVYHARTLRLLPGDTLFFYTDGISEAMDAELTPYGEARLRTLLSGLAPLSMRRIIGGVRADVAAHLDGTHASDDITMLSVRYRPIPES